MADGGQRLLDVIDDPNALESFLGGLTADSELLPSAETVDNVVASLARSLDENEYEVDSPNETLFDTLDSSSNHLTDISRSYVPSDFDHVVQNDAFTSNLDGFSNGNNVIRGNLSSHHEQQTPIGTSGCDQFVGSNSVISASSVSSVKTVTSNNIKQLSVSNCDPSKSTSNFVQAGQIQLTQNSISSASNNLNFTFSQDLQHKHSVTVSASQNQLNQVTSLSSVSVEGQIQQNVPSNSTNNLISVVGSANENGVVGSLSDTSRSFQVVSNNQQSGQIKAQNLPPNNNNNSSQNTSANNIQVTSGSSSVSNAPVTNDATASSNATSNVSLSNSVCATSVIGSTASIQQQAQQYITSTSTQQSTAVNQLVSGQTVSIPSMTSAGGGQSYIAMEQPTTAFITGHNPFGSANVALVATGGGTPTYAVLPTTQQFLTNAIIPQSHTIQTLTKTANGAYFQTTGTPQLVATSNVNALQNVSVANATSDAMSSTIVKPKQPPQLLPKPLSQVNTTVTTSTSSMTTPPVTSVSSSTESSGGTGSQQQQTSLPATSTSTASTSVTDGVVTQIIQQSQHQLSSVGGNTGTVALTPQQSFAIGNATGLGQVVVSQVGSLSTMTAPQQAQLAGTIVVNQYGQPMLLPTASTAQAGALQLILRQQPTQQQVLTIQTPSGAATLSAQATGQTNAAGKPIVRYVSQVPQVAQTSGYGLQQIQTPNGPAWVANQYMNQQQQQQQQQHHHQRTQSNQTQTQPQQMRDTEQQQISVPDSSSEPPPPKKAKTKSKNSKKKVTLDLEQLLKQSGIMDEDLNDDMSFDFGFGSMDTQPNGFPPSPQIPPAQIPVINTTETPKKSSSKKSKSNAKKSPATPQPPPAPVTLPSPSAKTPKRKSPSKKKPVPPPTPPPPPSSLPPPPPPIVTTPSKSKSSKKKSGSSANENQKSEPKTASSKKTVPPKKISSLDTLLATIDAVAAAAGASNTALISLSPTPPPPPAPSRTKPTPSPKTKSRSKSSKAQATPVPPPAKTEPPPPPIISIPSSIPPPPVATYSQSYVSAPSISVSQSFLNNTNSGIPSVSVAPSQHTSVAPTQSINAPTSSPRASTPNLTNGSTSVTTSNTGVTRVVQTIQLTPQNQQLLRNIQTQIQKLCALPKRSETEQSALQKLVVLQQQVIATGIPVPNPAHLNNENTHGKGPFGTATSVPVSSAPSTSSVSVPFSQHHVPSSSSYMPSTYSMARSMVDDKKAEEQRLANLKAEEEKRARWKKEEFEMLLQRDQQYVVKPDYEVPFASQKDAVERLMKYHIYRDRNDMNFEEFDAEFGNNAGILLEKFSVMLSKYRNLLLKESMKEVGCPERVMLERMFVSEEKVRLEQDRMLVAHGDYLELPPPPDSWVPKIKEMVDKEMVDYEHQDPVVSQQVQSAIDSIIGCEADDTSNYLLEESDKIEYDAFGVPINSSGYAGLTSAASSADIDEAVRSILT
ncbi:hypothetical protein Ocin01_05029 [Orchesella cincta]|uniref:GLTSCR protein conserved domain-containing protein n=1 Tax=Orchesella cincta TaxID=48709 RepID=A0A1D2N9G5_ORCCI|nr:hypothetical protein Ocin01_05029 [Orchesella cincta]